MEYVDWVSFVLSFLLVIALLGATLWGLKRFGRMQLQNQSGQASIKLIDSFSLGARQRIILVESDDQRVLVGISPQSITGLSGGQGTGLLSFLMCFVTQVLKRRATVIRLVIFVAMFVSPAFGDALPIVTVTEEQGATQYSLTLQLLALMTLLSVLPAMLLGLTSFVRIIIVLSLLRQALGTMQTPPNTVLVGIALFLTFFVMAPVFNSVYDTAILPFLNEEISIEAAIAAAEVPVRGFMLNQTRQEDIGMFVEIVGMEAIPAPDDVPFSIWRQRS